MSTKQGQGRSVWQRSSIALLAAPALVMALLPAGNSTDSSTDALTSVIVREAWGAGDQPEALVEAAGGTVEERLDIVDGFVATVPVAAVASLEAHQEILQITPNATLQLSAAGWEDASTLGGADPRTHPGSLNEVAKYVAALEMWAGDHTGAGVDIALIDSGVAPVNGLTTPGKIINGPDLSFESQYDNLRYLDTFGHGTHMAGIIAGRDDQVTAAASGSSSDFLATEFGTESLAAETDGETSAARTASDLFVGVAPDARIVSIKVADAHGVTDVSQVIAAIDWVIQNRQSSGLNIRVLNLSFGTDSTQPYVLDPLAFAAEQAWHKGVVVVVAAGNDGNAQPLRNPAMDPFVIAVGAVDPNQTNGRNDDTVAAFSNCGTLDRSVDVVAHGRSITSLRAPGSYADLENPGSVVADRLFVGSGTSQAAAVVTGVVALLLDENPDLTPDQVKALLEAEAAPLGGASALCQGGGVVDAFAAARARPPRSSQAAQKHTMSKGNGSLEASRGTDHLTADGVILAGEQDIMGNPWNGFGEIVTKCWKEGKGKKAVVVCEDQFVGVDTLWDGGSWNGTPWSGTSWSGTSWSGTSWSGTSWSGTSWSGTSWSGTSWSGAAWSDAAWTGTSWSGTSWSGTSWSGTSWSGTSWSGDGWLGIGWG